MEKINSSINFYKDQKREQDKQDAFSFSITEKLLEKYKPSKELFIIRDNENKKENQKAA